MTERVRECKCVSVSLCKRKRGCECARERVRSLVEHETPHARPRSSAASTRAHRPWRIDSGASTKAQRTPWSWAKPNSAPTSVAELKSAPGASTPRMSALRSCAPRQDTARHIRDW
eukprot:2795605-Pleurochrysis_carterae.AAC.4